MSGTVQEAFIYNYETKQWTRFKCLDDGTIDEKNTAKLHLFGFFMSKIVKEMMGEVGILQYLKKSI